MKYVIIYWSRYGNGKKIVEYLSGILNKKASDVKIFKTDEADPTDMPEADLYVFSAPVEAFNVQKNMRKFMKNLQGMQEKKYAIINTHGMQKKNWLYKMEKLLSKKNMVKVAQIDFHVGKKASSGDDISPGWQEKIDEFAEKI
jgi:flavodoxin